MFERIDFKGLRQSALFGYAADTAFFKGKRKIEFKPGLNILYGPNGCGKSTILKILADTMCAAQCGISMVTQTAVSGTVDLGQKQQDKIGVRVVHDGQPVMFCDPRTTVGLRMGSFDDDFFSKGVGEITTQRKKSHGQASASRLESVLAVLTGKAPAPGKIGRKFTKAGANDLWGGAIDVVEARMRGECAAGQFSVLLDEPEANFSLRWQHSLWNLLSQQSVHERVQVIVASHSPFALGIEHAHYIDMVEGYRQEAEHLLTDHFGARARATA